MSPSPFELSTAERLVTQQVVQWGGLLPFATAQRASGGVAPVALVAYSSVAAMSDVVPKSEEVRGKSECEC
jgi:hypothetical protein